MSVFVLPDLGEGLIEAEIVQWHVVPGDHVVSGQPLVSMETDKAVVEVPAPWAGTITELHGAPGDVVAVGSALVTFGEGAPDAATVVGHLPEARTRGVASPAVRALAGRLGIDVDVVSGSGPGGVVTSEDVVAAATSDGVRLEPLRGVRRAMATTMVNAQHAAVPATLHDLADVDPWLPEADPTVRLLRAIGVAATTVPALNAEYLGPDHGRRIHQDVHVGVAVETGEGLFVPVLRDVTRRNPEELRAQLNRLRSKVSDRSIRPEELSGATITMSNFGMYGGLFADLVVVPPQVAIVGAGRIHDAVIVRSGVPVVRSTMPISLTFDHRVVTGVEATSFLSALLTDLQLAT